MAELNRISVPRTSSKGEAEKKISKLKIPQKSDSKFVRVNLEEVTVEAAENAGIFDVQKKDTKSNRKKTGRQILEELEGES